MTDVYGDWIMNFSHGDNYREIDLNGCELIGVGKNASVYKMDEETILKVADKRDTSLEGVKRELDNAHTAFVYGIPTAISYDVVKVGPYFGAVYEHLSANTVWQNIKADYSRYNEFGAKEAVLLRTLHKIVLPAGTFPYREDVIRKRVDDMKGLLGMEEVSLLHAMLDAVPKRENYIHGDFHHKNIMVHKGELLLIDMANSSQGHPIYDLMSVYLADYINSEREPGFFNRTGLTREQVKDEWEVFKRTYLDTSDPDTLDAFQNAVSFYGELRWLIYLKRLPDDNPMKAEGIDRACKDFFPSVEDKIRTTGVWFKKAFA